MKDPRCKRCISNVPLTLWAAYTTLITGLAYTNAYLSKSYWPRIDLCLGKCRPDTHRGFPNRLLIGWSSLPKGVSVPPPWLTAAVSAMLGFPDGLLYRTMGLIIYLVYPQKFHLALVVSPPITPICIWIPTLLLWMGWLMTGLQSWIKVGLESYFGSCFGSCLYSCFGSSSLVLFWVMLFGLVLGLVFGLGFGHVERSKATRLRISAAAKLYVADKGRIWKIPQLCELHNP